MLAISGSIVLFNNPQEQLQKAINSFLNTELNVKLYLIDNSPTDELKYLSEKDVRIEYIFNNHNAGFGTAHNIGIKKSYEAGFQYHLILNPDIYHDRGVLENIISFMESKSDVGLVMPQVLYPNGDIQYLAKLLPTPLDFFVRRLMPFKKMKKALNDKFELRFSGYDSIMDIPYLSGCYMVFKTELLKKINGFDENIFLHMEDIDITRRSIQAGYRTVFYPSVFVYHDHEFKSFKNLRTLKIYLRSAVYYFNKWGWFFDKDRKLINEQTIYKIKKDLNKNV